MITKSSVWLSSLLFLSALLGLHSFVWLYRIAPQHVGGDFFIYWNALETLSAAGNPYEPFRIGTGFLNHPFLLTLISPLKLFGNAQVRLWVWWLIGALAWLAGLGVVGRLVGEGRGITAVIPSRSVQTISPLFLFLLFVPVTETFYVGQVNFIVTLLICLCCLWDHQGHNLAAGIALGGAILLKTSPLVLLFYFVAVRNWRGLLAACGTVVGGTAVSILQFSPKWIPYFLDTLTQINADIHTGQFNQSVVVLLYRMFQMIRIPVAGATFLRVATLLQGAIILFLIIHAWRKRNQPASLKGSEPTSSKEQELTPSKEQEPSIWLYAIFNSLMVLFSPLVWAHHIVFLLLPLGLLMTARKKVGIAVFSLFQLNRLFETYFYPIALPSGVGMVLLLIFLWIEWVRGRKGETAVFPFAVGSIAGTLIGGYYKCEHVNIDMYEVNTHRPQAGAYRAPSAPQMTFALESNKDEMAHQLGINSFTFRSSFVLVAAEMLGVHPDAVEIISADTQMGPMLPTVAAVKSRIAWLGRSQMRPPMLNKSCLKSPLMNLKPVQTILNYWMGTRKCGESQIGKSRKSANWMP